MQEPLFPTGLGWWFEETLVSNEGSNRLCVAFETEQAFLAEYAENIANGGIFVETELAFELRQQVHVEIKLSFCEKQVSLAGEVVHVIPPEMAQAGASAGVALQLLAPAEDLRAKFENLLGTCAGKEEPTAHAERRSSARSAARVSAKVEAEDSGTFVVHTRDISRTGVLISVGADPLPVGQRVSLALTHPISGEQLPVEGEVVRHMVAEDGEVAALGIQFDTVDPAGGDVSQFVDRVATTEHSRRLGSITGPISELGMARTLEMFAVTAPQGTLILRDGPKEAFVVLAQGYVLDVGSGRQTGVAALADLLSWRRGVFAFETHVADEVRDAEPIPFDEALRDAAALPKKPAVKRASASSLLVEGTLRLGKAASEQTLENLCRVERAVVDLARAGMTVAKVLAVVPEPREAVLEAIQRLRGQKLVALS